jgi:UrcA family protein
MKTTTAPFAIPIAMLAASLFLAAPTAQAEPAVKTFEVRFAYNPASGADKIYTDLKRTAQRACDRYGPRSPLRMQKLVKTCAADVVDKGVQAIGRTDLAALHYGLPMAQIASNR